MCNLVDNNFVLSKVLLYLGCELCNNSLLKLTNKKIYRSLKNNCNIIFLKKNKNLKACINHSNNDLIQTILKLNKLKNKNNSIHFNNAVQLEYAKNYLVNFGKISHYCCNNTGVMFIKHY